MKKILVGLCAALVLAGAAGCTSYDVTTNKVGWSMVADISVKDYEVLGIVSLDTEEVSAYSPLGLFRSIKGRRIVWSDLMAEAGKLGADDVVNVRIEMQNTNKRRPGLVEFFTGYTNTWRFRATALAVKFTEPVNRVQSGLVHDLSDQDSK